MAAIEKCEHNLGGSRFLKVCHGSKMGPVPILDLDLELGVQNAVRDLIRAGLVKSAHDCSEGGLGVALAECCFNPAGLLGAEITLDSQGSLVEVLFNEAQSRIVVSCEAESVERVLSKLKGVPHSQLGRVTTDELTINGSGKNICWSISELHDLWWNAIRRAVESESEPLPSL